MEGTPHCETVLARMDLPHDDLTGLRACHSQRGGYSGGEQSSLIRRLSLSPVRRKFSLESATIVVTVSV